ncbi:MAG TPA: DNA topoisomerase IB [Alphaproteobacteria bacterium]|nr:DNA topoisomerase IB [Alphaproteobacteria bacterium]
MVCDHPFVLEPAAAARAAGLRYVADHMSGIHRKRAGRAFSYRDAKGEKVTDPVTLARIRKLAIPPAWQDVWICASPNGHLQATGIDARGRKQYRYHANWRAVRDETKYSRMLAFGRALPAIREQVARDLRREGLPREKMLATIVRLLETTLIRVGNREYARENDSFGLTTLRNRHVKVEGGTISFEFRAKSGKMRKLHLKDRTLARIVKRARDLPGYELFQYVDKDGERRSIDSDDVNQYLKEASGADFTAKDFRTWAGTVLAALALREFEAFDSEAAAKRNITQAIEQVASKLGNTASICRKCYVHPALFDAYLDGTLAASLKQEVEATLAEELEKLPPEEAAVLAFLEHRLAEVAADGHS